ncbi:MAG: hypothetical protein KA133_12665 [Flavobacterium sp.]|nr:hypothetical protein [Flavobacterium sp.]MBP6760096.1 hypothetical protein [Flavobacterium sp.]
MKQLFLILGLMFFGCNTKNKERISETNILEKKSEDKQSFYLGDVNNDKVQDTAFVNFNQQNEYSDMIISFSNSIPEIELGQSFGVFIKKTEDLNFDGANEIIIFSRTHEGWWNYISVWSFHNNKWKELKQTKGFVSDDKDFENRIVKDKNQYYLIGEDKWNEDENGNFKKVKIKI